MTLIPGDGIGPEISASVRKIYAAAKVPVEWEEVEVRAILKDGETTIPQDAYDSIYRNKIALKGAYKVGRFLANFLAISAISRWEIRDRHLRKPVHSFRRPFRSPFHPCTQVRSRRRSGRATRR